MTPPARAAPLLLLATTKGRAGLARRTGLLAAYLVAAHVLALLTVYPLQGWAAVRVLLVAAPPVCLALGCRVAAVEQRRWRATLTALALAITAALAIQAHWELTADRRAARAEGVAQAAGPISAITPGQPARVLIASGAFLYGWLRYPTLVVWRLPESPRRLVRVVERGGADAVALPATLPRRERHAARLAGLGFVPQSPPGAPGTVLYLRAQPFAARP